MKTTVKAFYTDTFVLPLPPHHRFPMRKYSRLRERLLAENILAPGDLLIPPAATDDQLLLVHTPNYLERVKTGRLTAHEIRAIGFPWSEGMVERSRRSTGATVATAQAALADGLAANLAGGTHHAFADWAQGFCVFNDAAVAARVLQRDHGLQRIAILDLDVHQGNGTAAIFANDPTVFTCSVHGAKNFPFRKVASDLDVPLPDDTTDDAFLAACEHATRTTLTTARPDLVIYLAGADPFVGDRLGKLAVSKAGLAARDELVLTACQQAGLPVAVTMAGGYAHDIEDIVDIHLQTIRRAAHHAHAARRATA